MRCLRLLLAVSCLLAVLAGTSPRAHAEQTLRIALVASKSLVGSSDGDRNTNLANCLSWIDRAVAQGAQMVCFPECNLSGYQFGGSYGMTQDSVWVQAIVDKAIEDGIYIGVGFAERLDASHYYNTYLLTGPQGVIGTMHKQHLTLASEVQFGIPGTDFPVYDVAGIPMGILICADGSHFEKMQALANNGARVILGPAANQIQSTPASWFTWRTTAPYDWRAWAASLGVHIAACNNAGWYSPHVPGQTALVWASGAMFIGPDGSMLLQSPTTNNPANLETMILYDILRRNAAPSVYAGADATVQAVADLDGSVSDDGRPEGSAITTTWSALSGPGTVTFGNAASAHTTATFSTTGMYVLRLTATDTELTAWDDVTIVVTGAGGIVGSAIALDGIDDFLDLQAFIVGDTSFSLEAWIQTTESQGWILGNNEQTDLVHASGWPTYKNRMLLQYKALGASNDNTEGTRAVNDGQWHHLVAVYDKASGQGCVYVDGAMDGTPNPVSGPANLGLQAIGNLYDVSATAVHCFGGLIDELRIYTRTLTPGEVTDHYNGGAGQYGDEHDSDLLAGWHFDEGGGALAHDYSGNGHHATLTNGAGWAVGLVTIPAPPSHADFTGDARVDGLDFLVWQSNFLRWPAGGADKAHGDASEDGKVDGLDFLEWQVEFGREHQ